MGFLVDPFASIRSSGLDGTEIRINIYSEMCSGDPFDLEMYGINRIYGWDY
jgi:hypothetical protein